jgi:hypothetical protein
MRSCRDELLELRSRDNDNILPLVVSCQRIEEYQKQLRSNLNNLASTAATTFRDTGKYNLKTK